MPGTGLSLLSSRGLAQPPGGADPGQQGRGADTGAHGTLASVGSRGGSILQSRLGACWA